MLRWRIITGRGRAGQLRTVKNAHHSIFSRVRWRWWRFLSRSAKTNSKLTQNSHHSILSLRAGLGRGSPYHSSPKSNSKLTGNSHHSILSLRACRLCGELVWSWGAVWCLASPEFWSSVMYAGRLAWIISCTPSYFPRCPRAAGDQGHTPCIVS